MLAVEKMKFEIDDIIKALGVSSAGSIGAIGFNGVSTDSRSIKDGELFFALKGERFDGHDYLDKAVASGAAGVVVSSDYECATVPVFKVEDTLKALGDLASYVRDKHDILCAAVTGSNGKTTTKEMLSAIVQSKYHTFKTLGNFNNLIGLPLSIFHLENSHQAAVLELGMNTPGEILRLAEICKPRIGVFTNVAPVHLEYLGSIEDVAKAKYELIERLPADGTVVLNADDDILAGWIKDLSQTVITYGIDNEADFKVESFQLLPDGASVFMLNGIEYKINFSGKHNIYNAACAIAAASAFGIKPSEVVKALANIKPYNLRSEIINRNGITIINDCYNANPTSMRAAIDLLSGLDITGRRIAVLGDMLELGQDTVRYHELIGEYLSRNKIEALFATGELGSYFLTGFSGDYKEYFNDKKELLTKLISYIKPGDGILIKGSRKIALEHVTDELMRVI